MWTTVHRGSDSTLGLVASFPFALFPLRPAGGFPNRLIFNGRHKPNRYKTRQQSNEVAPPPPLPAIRLEKILSLNKVNSPGIIT